MNKVLLYIAILLSFSSKAVAINSPEIRCVMVVSNGDVNLTWTVPADPLGEFASYEVFYSTTLAGPYSNIFSVTTYSPGTYSTTGLNANIQRLYFFVRTKNMMGVLSPAIDTVGTIFLTMNSPGGSSVASFNWLDFHNPLPAGVSSFYKIYREYPVPGGWTQIGTMPVNGTGAKYYYNDTINVCSDSINYRVELFDPVLSCTSMSNIKGDNFIDKNPPSPPMLDSVSIDINGHVIMGIHPSHSSDAKCFVIYQWASGTYNAIDTVCTNNTPTVFTYTNSNPNGASEEFSVAAIDSCGNISVIALNNQATIFATATYDVCNKTANLSWNPYKNMTGGVDHYEVLYSLNAGAFVHLADVTGTTYAHTNLIQGSTYWYRIRAHSVLKSMNLRDSITSTSNTDTVRTVAGSTPAFVYLSDVTVNNPSESADVKWHIDNTVKVGGFIIYRSDNFGGPYSSVGTTGYMAQSNYSFNDNSAQADVKPYYYYVKVLDTCMTPIMKTDSSHTIFLSAAASGNFNAILNWTDYSKWSGNVVSYNIYRSLDGIFSSTPIANVPFGTNTYNDDVSAYTMYSGKFTYYVEAVEGPGNIYGLAELSASNYANVYVDALMFVPNAFVPRGHNKLFLPVGDYVEKSDYKLTIFDRWGSKVFETTDEFQGWDGGKDPEGLYGYLIEYKNAMGEHRNQRGSVTLVR